MGNYPQSDLRKLNLLLGEALLKPDLCQDLLDAERRARLVAHLPLSRGAANAIKALPDSYNELGDLALVIYSNIFQP